MSLCIENHGSDGAVGCMLLGMVGRVEGAVWIRCHLQELVPAAGTVKRSSGGKPAICNILRGSCDRMTRNMLCVVMSQGAQGHVCCAWVRIRLLKP